MSFRDIEGNKKLIVNVSELSVFRWDRILKKRYWTVGNSGRLIGFVTDRANQSTSESKIVVKRLSK